MLEFVRPPPPAEAEKMSKRILEEIICLRLFANHARLTESVPNIPLPLRNSFINNDLNAPDPPPAA